MQDDLVQMRQAVAQAIATKKPERQAHQAQSTADEWYRRAQLAQANEPLARNIDKAILPGNSDGDNIPAGAAKHRSGKAQEETCRR